MRSEVSVIFADDREYKHIGWYWFIIYLNFQQDDATIKQNMMNSDLKPAYKSSPATPAPMVRFRIPAEDHHAVRGR